MHKMFKYAITVVELPEHEVTQELSLESDIILRPDDDLKLEIAEEVVTFRVASVQKVD
jgi:hypothetical protein